jgi:Rod binding domain-containing protein
MELIQLLQTKDYGLQKLSNGKEDNHRINTKDEYKKVAREMESLFVYQLIKIMRETATSISSEKKGIGYNTYMSMFDMEISRLLAKRGVGLQDAIVNWLDRMPYNKEREKDNNGNNINSKY